MTSLPVYTLEAERTAPLDYGRGPKASRDRQKRACVPPMRVPIFKVVLRKEGTLRVPRKNITCPADAHEVAYALIGDRPFENLAVLFVNSAAAITGAILVGTSSSIASVPMTVRGVFTAALLHNAAAIILAHNHPSGNPTPSDDDIRSTRELRKAADILGVPILDHLIVTHDPERWQSITC